MWLPPSLLRLAKGFCLQVATYRVLGVKFQGHPALALCRSCDGVSREVLICTECCACAAGNLRTSDFDGPYNISLLDTQYNEIKGKDTRRVFVPASDIPLVKVQRAVAACSWHCCQAELF